jgi:kynureninase
MPALRARSVALTGYLAELLSRLPIEVVTPPDPSGRGAQLSLRFDDAEAVLSHLVARGVVADYRAPDIIRVAPVPPYNTFHEAWRFAGVLSEVLWAS